jgi:hypothetical protein
MTPVIGTDDVIIMIRVESNLWRTGELCNPGSKYHRERGHSGVIAAKQQPAEDHGGLRST